MDVIVIGAGASGIIAALKMSKKANVTLLEKNDKSSKKILVTGNGRCNYWNSDININKYNTDSKEKLERILSKKDETYAFLSSLGIYPTIKDGYYYPHSLSSLSIKEIFDKSLEKNVKVEYNVEVLDVKREDNKFKVITNGKEYLCDKLVFAMGSKAAPKTGSDGKVYDILQNMGLKITPVLPALIGLKANESYLKDWNGIRVESSLKLYIDNEFIKESVGELQLTDYGISGICTFNLSSIVSKALHSKKKVNVKINFFEEDFYKFMENNKLDLTIEETMESLFNYKLMHIFFKLAKVSKSKKWIELNQVEKKKLASIVNDFNLDIVGTNGYERAQVCTGGLSLNEINPETMETRINNLYVIGETLDVDGECGGFNLAFAFITGYIVGDKIA